MGKEKVLFKSEEKWDVVSVIAFLRQLTTKLVENVIILQQGDDEITLSIPDQVVSELKVEEEENKSGIKQSFEFEMEWMEKEAAGTGVTLD